MTVHYSSAWTGIVTEEERGWKLAQSLTELLGQKDDKVVDIIMEDGQLTDVILQRPSPITMIGITIEIDYDNHH